jgi:hypothetical protein
MASKSAKVSKSAAFSDTPDPIFPAIEKHRQAWEAFGEACKRADDVEAEKDGRRSPPPKVGLHASGEFERLARKAFLKTPIIAARECA